MEVIVSRFFVSVRVPAMLVALVVAFAAYSAVQAQNYQDDDLPPGVLAATINGQPVDADDTPVVNESQPVISGQVEDANGSVTITITSTPITFVAPTDAAGNFSARVPEPLENGLHTLYFNGQRIGDFIVAADATPTVTATVTATATVPSTATPAPPATGAGTATSGDWSLAGAGVVGIVVAGTVVAMYALRQRSNRA